MRLDNVLHVVNAHCEGVVCDVLVGGLPKIAGSSVLAKKKYFEEHLDHFRTLLCLEPRGTETQNVNVIVDSVEPGVDFGFLTLEKEEIVEMSGGNIISTATVLLETGAIPIREPFTDFRLETASGVIDIRARCEDGRVKDVTFTNQPSFVLHRDALIDVPSVGRLRVDVVWGGMWYVVVDAVDLGLQLHPREHKEVVRLGELVKMAAREQLAVAHPTHPEFADFIQATLIAGAINRDGQNVHSRNAVVVSPGYIDRCPCGTGTSGRLALLHARREISMIDTFVHESLIGTKFVSRIVATDVLGGVPAIIPSVTGRAWITGTSQVAVDPTDPFPHGFSMETLANGTVMTRL